MVDSRTPPQGDGLNDLFGPNGFQLTPTASPVVSRRELRSSPSASSLVKPVRVSKKNRAATTPRARRAAPPVPTFVRPADSAYPADRVLVVVRPPKKRLKRKRGSALLTVVAVIGLFGSVALPAAAFAPKDDVETAKIDADVAAASTAALSVSSAAKATTAERGQFSATTAVDLRRQRATSLMAANYERYVASGALDMGDDYPWFSELSNNQGGGLSPLNYFYRECVDFVAWRLNRDAGSTSAPFKYVWSNLTPNGGNASQWKRNWLNHGWPTSTTPIAGSVAWFNGNHIAYVKQVNADGTVLLEEYNYASDHLYGQRTIAPGEAALYLYPPPR